MNNGIPIFNQLLIGLSQYQISHQSRQNNRSQESLFSTLLLRACNALTSQPSVEVPKTLSGWLHKFSTPVSIWWPSIWSLPDSYDATFSLLDGNQLSEEASIYLYDELLSRAETSETADNLSLNLALDNLPFKNLLYQLKDLCKNATGASAERIQKEYVQLRRFLIEHPFTTSTAITTQFALNEYVHPQTVGQFYDDCAFGESFQLCNRCGPMRSEGNEWRGLRPSVCDQHDIKIITAQRDSRQLKLGLRWRVCMPGLPELRLFNELLQLQAKYSKRLTGVSLWPNMDVYDVQLKFSDGDVWAIDVKDYRHPHQMAKKISRIPTADELPHRMGFYVVPDHRTKQDNNYVDLVRSEAKSQIGIEILDETTFIGRVESKLRTRLKSNRR